MWLIRRCGSTPAARKQVLWAVFVVMLYCMYTDRGEQPHQINYEYQPVASLIEGPIVAKSNSSVFHDTENAILRKKIEELLVTFSKTEVQCEKIVPMGGYYCNTKPDGQKRVCLDRLFYPSSYCPVYSFGIGHDFTFEMHMAKFGCDVYAFDSDREHVHYPTYIGDRLTYYQKRLGKNFMRETVYRSDIPGDTGFLIEYWPMEALMRHLGHQHHHLFYLKLDIEGSEWGIFESSLFETNILERVQQLAIEIHFEDLRHNGTTRSTEELLKSIDRYERVAKGLRQRGFRLAHWEPNFKAPEFSTIAGTSFHVYSETLWLNPSCQKRPGLPPHGIPPPYLT